MKKTISFFLIIALLILFGCKAVEEDDLPGDATSDATADIIDSSTDIDLDPYYDPTADTDTDLIVDPDTTTDADTDPNPVVDPDPIVDPEPDPILNPVVSPLDLSTLNHIDLSEAKSAVITTHSVAIVHNYKWWNPLRYIYQVALAAHGDITKLFKVTDDGYYQEVFYEKWTWPYNLLTDPSSDQYDPLAVDATEDAIIEQVLINTILPVAVISVNSNYSAVFFSEAIDFGVNYATENASFVYLVNNLTGESRSILEYGNPLYPPNYYINAEMYRETSNGVYYIAHAHGTTRRQVVRFDTLTEEFTIITPVEDHVIYFEVADDGTIIYYGYNWNDFSQIANLVLTDGQIQMISNTKIINFWKAPNGKLHYFDSSNVSGESDILEISVDAQFNVLMGMYIENTLEDIGSAEGCYLLKTNDRTIYSSIMTPDIDGDFQFIEIGNSDKIIKKFKWKDIGISTIDTITTDDDSIFIAGDDLTNKKVLKKLSKEAPSENRLGSIGFSQPQFSIVAGNTVEDLFSPDEYSISKMIPNGTGGIIFTGTRLLDAIKVIAERDSQGVLTIYETGSDAEALAIAKLK